MEGKEEGNKEHKLDREERLVVVLLRLLLLMREGVEGAVLARRLRPQPCRLLAVPTGHHAGK